MDEEWIASGADNESYCSLTTFWNYWKRNHANIIVRKPSKDICGVCYQFHIGNRRAGEQGIDNGLDSDDEDDNAAIPTESERLSLESKRIARDLETLETAKMIRQHIEDATSMRELCQKAIEDAKRSTRNNLADKETVITIVVDYCQNMEMPFFRKRQAS